MDIFEKDRTASTVDHCLSVFTHEELSQDFFKSDLSYDYKLYNFCFNSPDSKQMHQLCKQNNESLLRIAKESGDWVSIFEFKQLLLEECVAWFGVGRNNTNTITFFDLVCMSWSYWRAYWDTLPPSHKHTLALKIQCALEYVINTRYNDMIYSYYNEYLFAYRSL